MSEEFQIFPQEVNEAGEGAESAEVQKLDDATYEPRAYVEQAGDYKQAEAIQDNFAAVVDSAKIQAVTGDAVSGVGFTQEGQAIPRETHPVGHNSSRAEGGLGRGSGVADDELGSSATVFGSGGTITFTQKDTSGNTIAQTTLTPNATMRTTQGTFDESGNKVSETDTYSSGAQVERTYDSDGKVTDETFSKDGESRAYHYDDKGNAISDSMTTQNPDGSYTTTKTEEDGTIKTFNLDSDGNITSVTTTNPDGTQTTTEFDANGATTQNPDGSYTTTKTEEDGTIKTSNLDFNGNITSVTTTYPDGTTETSYPEAAESEELESDGIYYGSSNESGSDSSSGDDGGDDSSSSSSGDDGGDDSSSSSSGDDGGDDSSSSSSGDDGGDDGGGDNGGDGGGDGGGGGDEGGGEGDGGDENTIEGGEDDSGYHGGILVDGGSSGVREKDDTGHQMGVMGGLAGSGGSSGGDSGDDTGGKEGIYLGGSGKVYPDSGGARPIDPIRMQEQSALEQQSAANAMVDRLLVQVQRETMGGENLNAQKLKKQTGKG